MATIGDIFQIPIDENRVGYGQIMARKLGPNPDLVVVFDYISQASIVPTQKELLKIVETPILFIANTFDVLIENGRWKTIGNLKPNLERVPLPCYKMGSGHFGSVMVESYDGKKRRKAKKDEVAILDNRNSVSAMRVENVLKAKHGIVPWKPKYEQLMFERNKRQSEIAFPSMLERIFKN